jgi:CRP-like cAMP-binding protein
MATKAPLSEFPLFKDLPEELLDKLAKFCEEETYEEGAFIFREGDKAECLHFLLDGSIVLKVKLTSRPESITVSAVNQKYESFGWSGIVPPFHYTASAVCEEKCQVMMLPGDKFMQLLQDNTDAGFIVMQRLTELISGRLRTSRQGLLKTL